MSELDVLFSNTLEYGAEDFRLALDRPLGEGVEGYGDLRVTPGAAADSVDVAAGIGFVRGDGLNDLGLYRCRNDATKNSAAFEAGGIAVPDATKPRLDQIIARVYDDAVDSEGQHKWRLAVLKGTPTTGATLDNREGAAALPNSAMLIADVLVPAGAPAVLEAGSIRDRRPFAYPIVPPLLTDVDMVPLIPLGATGQATVEHTPSDLHQGAVPVLVPRRVVNATKLRWKYTQGSLGEGVLAGNYVIALFDASGRALVDTGSVALTGAEGAHVNRSETIAATTFEAGVYWAFFGLNSSAGKASFVGCRRDDLADTLFVGAETGGLTVPKSLLGLSQGVGILAVPSLTLSVG